MHLFLFIHHFILRVQTCLNSATVYFGAYKTQIIRSAEVKKENHHCAFVHMLSDQQLHGNILYVLWTSH